MRFHWYPHVTERICPVCLQARVEEVVGWAWDVFQPLLFGLIGAEIRVSELEGHTVGEAAETHAHTRYINKWSSGSYRC